MDILEQIKTVNPSVAPALFRLLMREESVAYLRENNGIIGFEIKPDSEEIAGFALIGMRKRTVLAYRSEDTKPRLIIFPSMDKLFNHSFGLLGLSAKKVFIKSDDFRGKVLDEGVIADLVRDLTPPEKNVELPDQVTEQMIRIMISEHSDQEEEDLESAHASPERFKPIGSSTTAPTDTPPQTSVDDLPPVSNPYFVQNPSGTDSVTLMDPHQQVESRSFPNEHSIIDYVTMEFGVSRELLMKLLNALLVKTQGLSSEKRTHQFKQLVAKLLKEKPELIKK